MDRSLPPPAGIGPVGYRFGEFRLEADGKLLRGESALELPADELALLRALLTRSGEVASAGELTCAVWGEADASSHRLKAVLKSLKLRLHSADCIESVERRGYRISAIAEPDGHLRTGALPLLAILPFSNGYDVPEYLGLAVAEQAMEELSGARPAVASIAARDSVCALARCGLSSLEIGKMLHAELLLTGQILATPGRHRLRVETIRVEDGASLWVEDVIAERDQTVELAGELVNRVTSRLRGGEIPIAVEARAEPTAAVKRATSQAQREAHDLYKRAHYEWQSMERHRMQDAMGLLLRAIELDPELMAARVELAQLVILQSIHGYLSPRIAAATVRRAADGIPELNERADVLLPALGWVEFHFDRDARSALRMIARSAELPYDLANTRARSWLLLSRQRFGEAIELLRAAMQLDPYSPWLQTALAWALHLAGEQGASLTQIRKAIDFSSEYDSSLFFGAMILGYNGEAARAVELAEMLVARSSHYDLAISAHAYALACAGRPEESHSQLERMRWLSGERFVLNTLNAVTHVVLGKPDSALEALRTANENRCPWFFQMMADPRLTSLKGRHEFAALEASLTTTEDDAAVSP
jgi:DNA-binding winged helix-turn-helix (wHTH) protein/tetratricopeptide (TPR) repeat protein